MHVAHIPLQQCASPFMYTMYTHTTSEAYVHMYMYILALLQNYEFMVFEVFENHFKITNSRFLTFIENYLELAKKQLH